MTSVSIGGGKWGEISLWKGSGSSDGSDRSAPMSQLRSRLDLPFRCSPLPADTTWPRGLPSSAPRALVPGPLPSSFPRLIPLRPRSCEDVVLLSRWMDMRLARVESNDSIARFVRHWTFERTPVLKVGRGKDKQEE